MSAAAFAAPHFLAWAQALAQVPFNADKVTFCSDGEFDWHSGQSLYDFVILSREDGQFLISYLGIPHPSFEKRFFDNAWIKMKGEFYARKEAGDIFDSLETQYVLSLDLEGAKARRQVDRLTRPDNINSLAAANQYGICHGNRPVLGFAEP